MPRRCLRWLGAPLLGAVVACRAAPHVEHAAAPGENAPAEEAPAEEAAAPPHDVAAPPNCVVNGDFSAGIAPWGAHWGGASRAAPPEPRIESGALCTTLHGGDELIVGWPTAGRPELCALDAGKAYALSLRVSTGAPGLKCVVKVGHQLAPYTGAFVAELPSSAALSPFSAPFTPAHSDDRAGIAIECRAEPGTASADVCIDDVRLHS